MIVLTTYREPAFLGLHKKNTENKTSIKCDKPAFLQCYITGKAEELAGYDIPVFLEGEIDLSLPEQPCKLALKELHDGVLIQWPTDRVLVDEQKVYKGLICLENDEESLTYARKCQEKRRETA